MSESTRMGGSNTALSRKSETVREGVEIILKQRDEARTALAGILVALGIDLPVPVGEALAVALDRIEGLFGIALRDDEV